MEDADPYKDGSNFERKNWKSEEFTVPMGLGKPLNTPSKTRSRGDEIASVRGYKGKKNDLEKSEGENGSCQKESFDSDNGSST